MIYVRTIYVSSLSLDDGCSYCGGSSTTWDHVIPRAKRGKDTIENLIPCCKSCNSKKGSRPLDDFLIKIGNKDIVLPTPHTVTVKVYYEKSETLYKGTSVEFVKYSGEITYVTDDSNVVILSMNDIYRRVFSGGLKSNGAPNWPSSLY